MAAEDKQAPIRRDIYIRIGCWRTDGDIEAWVSTPATEVAPNAWLIEPTPDYDPDDQPWAFVPGDIVRCARKVLFDADGAEAEECLVAEERIPDQSRRTA